MVILFFTTAKLDKLNNVLKYLNIYNNVNVVFIDARLKMSASKVDEMEDNRIN